MIRQGKNRCSCLLQTFNSSKYGPLSLVLSHGRLNKITQPGLLFPLLLGLRYQHALTPTHTHTHSIHHSLSKILRLPSRYLKSWEASAFTSVGSTANSSPPLCYMVIYYSCRTLASASSGECFWESPVLGAVPQ